MKGRLLMISTDRRIFEEGSAVRERQIAYAREWQEVHIVVFAGREYKETAISPNCFVYPTRSRWRFLYPFGAMRIGRFIIPRRNITEITCQDASLTAMAGVALKDDFHIPLEIQMHDDMGSSNYASAASNRLRAWMARTYVPQADHIRVVSGRIKKFLVEKLGVSESKIEVRPIAVDTDWIRNAPILPDADLRKKYPRFEKIVLMVGRLEREKNMKLAIEAWPAVVAKLPRTGLVIVGEGKELASLKALARKRGIADDVVFAGWAGRAVLASYYKTAGLLLSTSLFEGYGMIFKESEAAGLKIVSTDVGIARETGAHVVDWNPADVARGILGAFGV